MDPIFYAWLAAAASPFLCAALAYLLIAPAIKYGLIDFPCGRKQHDDPTPLVGGLAIFLTVMLAGALLGRLPGSSWSLFAALMVTIAIGVADDAREVGHRVKFLAQIIAALIIASGTGVHVEHVGDIFGLGPLVLGKWSHMVTTLAIVGLMNAINMVDGLDGLAGKLTLVSFLAMVGAALGTDRTALALEMLVVGGAIAGFLSLNLRTPWRPKAIVFMGDTGGMLLGLLLAWYAMQLAGAVGAPTRPITAVWLIAVPLLDMGSVLLLRIMQKKSPFCADRQHMHYVLLDSGYTVVQVVALMSGVALVFALAALRAQHDGVPELVLFLAFLGVWVAYLMCLRHPRRFCSLAHRLIHPGRPMAIPDVYGERK